MCTVCQAMRPWSDECSLALASDASGTVSFAALREGADAAAGTATSYRMSVGDSFAGSYATGSDTDWVRVELVAGTTYVFSLNGTGGGVDTFLSLRNGAGTVIASNDDGSSFSYDSRLTFTASTSGTFYLEASQYEISAGFAGSPGTYQLTMEYGVSRPIWTASDMADQLISGYWAEQHFNVRAGVQAISVNLNGLTTEMRSLARAALQAWTDATGLTFTEVSGTAQITFTRNNTSSGPEAFATFITSNGFITSAEVNIDQEWLDSQGSGMLSYTHQTYIHEIGHALGLGHAGNYNGGAVYGTDNIAVNDSWQLTVMSYFDQRQNSFINGTYAYALTPMIADIEAIGRLYGTTATLRQGNTTYGDASTAGGNYDLFASTNTDGVDSVTMAMTVVDHGGTDLFNFGSFAGAQRIDLRAGMTSDVYGDSGTLVIALGTVIENAISGAGNDTLTGNQVANRLEGGAGNDLLIGNEGNDSLYGGNGADTLNGGAGDDFLFGGSTDADLRDVIYGGDGNDYIDAGAGNDEVQAGAGNDTVFGSAGADTLIGNEGHDLIEGGIGADALFGNAGNDTLNGGFAHDRLNGGAGADVFMHMGVLGHGSDWIQDYNAAQGDVLNLVLAGARADQLQINLAQTAGAGGAAAEAFVIYRPTGQILWALVDGGAQDHINVRIAGVTYDLLA